MITEHDLAAAAKRCAEFSDNPAVLYKLQKTILGQTPESSLYEAFMKSDVVRQLYEEQDMYGGFGPLWCKNYSEKAVFPTSMCAIERARYLSLTMDDGDILFMAKEYLLSFLEGKNHEKIRLTNERMIPALHGAVCAAIEQFDPYSPECDDTFRKWVYIADRAFADGEYCYERDAAAQHETFGTRERRLQPIEISLLTARRDQLPAGLEEAMLLYHGGIANVEGHFWSECPSKLPENFVYKYTRRYFHSFDFINLFTGSGRFLDRAVDWLWENQNADGLFDYGPQVKDPYGYFHNFSTEKGNKATRIVDCTMEILSFTRTYLDRNQKK